MHGDYPLSSSHLSHFDRLVLPHHVVDQDESLTCPVNVESLHKWNFFVYAVDRLMASTPSLINDWKKKLALELELPTNIRPKHRLVVNEKSRQVEKEIAPLLMSYLFRAFGSENSKPPIILQQTFTTYIYRQVIVHPTFWLLMFFWSHNKSQLPGIDRYGYT